jgi:hypothetical protein
MVEISGHKDSLIQLSRLLRDYPSLTAVEQIVDGLSMQPVYEARDGIRHISFADSAGLAVAHFRVMPDGRPNSLHRYKYSNSQSEPTVVERTSHYFGQPPEHGLTERGGSGEVRSYLVPLQQASAGKGNFAVGPRIRIMNKRTKMIGNWRAQVLDRAVPGGAIFIPVEPVQNLVCLPNRTGRVMPTVPFLAASLPDDGGVWRTNFRLADKRAINQGILEELGIKPKSMWDLLKERGYKFPSEIVWVNGFPELTIPEALIESFYTSEYPSPFLV